MLKKIVKYDKFIPLGIILIYFILSFLIVGYYDYNGHIDYKANSYNLFFGMKDNGSIIYEFNFYGFMMMFLYLSCVPFLFIKKWKKYNILFIGIHLSVVSLLSIFSLFFTIHGSVGIDVYFHIVPIYYIYMVVLLAMSILVIYLGYYKIKKL